MAHFFQQDLSCVRVFGAHLLKKLGCFMVDFGGDRVPRNEAFVLPLFKVVTSGDLFQIFPSVLPHIPLFHDLEVETPQIPLNPLFSLIVCLPENPTLDRILLEASPYLDLQFILMPSYGLHQLLHVFNFLLSLGLAYFDVLFP